MKSNDVIGGEMIIPDDWYVTSADFDNEYPFIEITYYDDIDNSIEISVPKSLAYYLSTHFCGSEKMRNLYIEQGRRAVRKSIKEVLDI